MPDRTIIQRYDHGGARIFIEREDGCRDLVVDIYDDAPAERREAIIQALLGAGIFPRKETAFDDNADPTQANQTKRQGHEGS